MQANRIINATRWNPTPGRKQDLSYRRRRMIYGKLPAVIMEFKRKVIIIGYGIVAKALLPLVVKHLRVPASHITIIDFIDGGPLLRPWIARGVTFVREKITFYSLARLLSSHVRPGDLIIDLAWSVEFFEIIRWAHDHEALYVNASLESWDPAAEMRPRPTMERTLYARYTRLLPLMEKWRGGVTAVIDHGSNPGLVSHFVKQGLIDIATAVLGEKKAARGKARQVRAALDTGRFAELAQALGVRVIHCSERDTQRANLAKSPDEFVSTWSVEGMWEESIAPVEIAWGTHEKERPPHAILPEIGPKNQIVLPQMGLNTWVRSWVPDEEIVGMVVPHGEAFGLSHALTVRKGNRVVYRPTVHYAYMPCNDALISLHELRARNYELHPRRRILTDEITTGTDRVGALIMGHAFGSWWVGSDLSIGEARKKAPGVNATAVQVAAGVLAAILWAVRNPRKGVRLPEDLPHEEILRDAKPYLGEVISQRSDWTPLSRHRAHFEETAAAQVDYSDPWQFKNFLFRP